MSDSSVFRICCIVEGEGDVGALPTIVRRIVAEVDPSLRVDALPSLRLSRSKMVKPRELSRMVELAARQLGGRGAILIAFDADDDCPAALGPQTLATAQSVRSDMQIGLVIAHKEIEAWFLAAAESLRGVRGLDEALTAPGDPEGIRDAKGWLRARQQERRYSPTVDQLPLARAFHLTQARSAPSFDKCYREVTRLLQAM